jgi:cytochrome c peroxidase
MMRNRMLMAVLVLLVGAGLVMAANGLTSTEELGKSIFFDLNLSLNNNESCASCHGPDVGFTGPLTDTNLRGSVYEGSVAGRFGARKPPTAAYATTSPIFHYAVDKKDALFIGGNFWDGRATGEDLGNPAADQAKGPFLNPVEQALSDNACVVYRVCDPTVLADYPVLLDDVYPGACDIMWPMDVETVCATEGVTVPLSPDDRARVDRSYDQIALAIAAYEGSPEVNSFSSKFDYVQAGLVKFTKDEKKGFNLFKGKGKCSACHVLGGQPAGEEALFTDYSFDNLGMPANPDNPVYDMDPGFVDPGLGGYLATLPELWSALAEENLGKHKVPTLRNVNKAPYPGFVKAYGHNGYFKSLLGIVHFYNTRDVKEECDDPFTTAEMAMAMDCWPEPEVDENVNDDELGDLRLTGKQEEQLVEFMKTLDDGWISPAE